MEYKIVFGYVPENSLVREKEIDEEKTAAAKEAWEENEAKKVERERQKKRIYDPKPWNEKSAYTGKTLYSTKTPTLDTVVNEAIAEGWVPHGSPHEKADGNMWQAMVKD